MHETAGSDAPGYLRKISYESLAKEKGQRRKMPLSATSCPLYREEKFDADTLMVEGPNFLNTTNAVMAAKLQAKPAQTFNISTDQNGVVDFSCPSKFGVAFFHRLMDCLLPSMCVLVYATRQARPTIILPSHLEEIYTYNLSALAPQQNFTVLSLDGPRRYTLMLPPEHTVTMVYPGWGLKHGVIRDNFQNVL